MFVEQRPDIYVPILLFLLEVPGLPLIVFLLCQISSKKLLILFKDRSEMEAVAAAGLIIQIADVGGRALLGMLKLLKDLRETPKQMTELLADVDQSVQRICSLKDALRKPTSFAAHVSAPQVQQVTECMNHAYGAIVDLQQALEPLFRKGNTSVQSLAKKTWRSVVSIQTEKSIPKRLARTERLNREVISALQLTGLEMDANIMCLCLSRGPHNTWLTPD